MAACHGIAIIAIVKARRLAMLVPGRRKTVMGFMVRLWSGVGLGGAYFSARAGVARSHHVLPATGGVGLRANQGELCSCDL
jgi:hypothetical protein